MTRRPAPHRVAPQRIASPRFAPPRNASRRSVPQRTYRRSIVRKSFEQSKETKALVDVFRSMTLEQRMNFAELSRAVGFAVKSTTSAYHSARHIVERENGIYIGAIRRFGCYRGTGNDMAGSLETMADSIGRLARRSVFRADLAIASNLDADVYARVSEHRNRASIIASTSSAPMPTSNRKRQEPSTEAEKISSIDAIRLVR
jgi:hypothetical protein